MLTFTKHIALQQACESERPSATAKLRQTNRRMETNDFGATLPGVRPSQKRFSTVQTHKEPVPTMQTIDLVWLGNSTNNNSHVHRASRACGMPANPTDAVVAHAFFQGQSSFTFQMQKQLGQAHFIVQCGFGR